MTTSSIRPARSTADGRGPVASPALAGEHPSSARVYDAALGGKDNYAVDRAVLEQLRLAAPGTLELARDHRAFLVRVARFIATHTDVTQYLDCGSGLPTAENVHQVVRRAVPCAKVVYVDDDPSVLAHGRALLADDELTMISAADVFRPADVLGCPAIRAFLDPQRPIALFLLGVLHHYDAEVGPAAIVAEYVDALPAGSYVALSHFLDPEDEDTEVARRLEQILRDGDLASGRFRTRAGIEALLPAGLELVEPGLVRCCDWWPDGPRAAPLLPAQRCALGVVARKP